MPGVTRRAMFLCYIFNVVYFIFFHKTVHLVWLVNTRLGDFLKPVSVGKENGFESALSG